MLYTAIFCLLIGQILSLHLKKQGDAENFINMYLDNEALDQFAVQIFAAHPFNSQIRECSEDQQIKYIHLGPNQPPIAIIMCNIHARQVITGEICLNWAQKYLGSLHSNLSINLFYLANRQRDKVIKQKLCVRKSDDEIDLNRNFPTEFDFYNASKNISSQIYPGTHPISQPFTICLDKMITEHQPLIFLDIHSGQNGGLFYQKGFNSDADKDIFQKLNQNVCDNNCRITTLEGDGQAINGHIFADLKVRKNMKYSLLIQSYGNNATNDCLKQFNPDTYQLKKFNIDKWVSGISLIIEEVRRRQNL